MVTKFIKIFQTSINRGYLSIEKDIIKCQKIKLYLSIKMVLSYSFIKLNVKISFFIRSLMVQVISFVKRTRRLVFSGKYKKFLLAE